MTAGMILAALGGLALVLGVLLQHRREVIALRLPPPATPDEAKAREQAHAAGFDQGLTRAMEIAQGLEAHYSEEQRLRNSIVAAIRGARRSS